MANGGSGFPHGGVGMAFDALLDGIQNIAFAIGEGTRDVFNKLSRAPLEYFLDLPYTPRYGVTGNIPQNFSSTIQQAINAVSRFTSGIDRSATSIRDFGNFIQHFMVYPSESMVRRGINLPDWLTKRGIEETGRGQEWAWHQAKQFEGLSKQLVQHLGYVSAPTTTGPQPFPYYEYAFAPLRGLFEWRMGFRQGLRGEASPLSAQQALYYGTPFFSGLAFRAAKEAEGKGGELDLSNLRRIMYESQRVLTEQARIFGSLFRTMFAGARNIRTLRDIGAPSYLIEEISRSYESRTIPQLQQVSSQISSTLSQYMQSFYHLVGMGGGSQLRAMNIFQGKVSAGYTFPVYSMEQVGNIIRTAQSSLGQLNQMLVFPRLRREAAISLQSGALTFANEFLTSLYSEGAKLPANLQTRLESIMTSQQQYVALREEMNKYLEIYNKYYPVASRKTEELSQLRVRERELARKTRTPEEEEEYKDIVERRTALEHEYQMYETAREKLPNLSEKINNIYRNLNEGIGSFINELDAAVREGKLDRSVIERTRAVLSHLKNLERTSRIILGEERLTPYEQYLQPTLQGIRSATEMFGVMNVRNFQIALMFGMSSMLFNALTQIPMEATYRTIQPLFGAIGGITGVAPFYQEIVGFGYQAPRVMSDIEARMASMQSLLGSRYFAESAISKAIEISRVQPIQFPEAMEILTAMSVYPSTRMYAMRESFQQQIFNAVQLLSMLAPEQGIGGALFAIRELLGGQFRSLQLRFNISPEILAAYAGRTVAQFKSAPGAEKIEILAKALEGMFGGEEVLFRRGAQFEVQLRNISDTLISSIALPMVKEIQPLFTSLVRELMGIRRGQRTSYEDIMGSTFIQLLPEAQQRGLRRVAEERAYMVLGLGAQERLREWTKQRLGREASPAEQIELLLRATRFERDEKDLEKLKDVLRTSLIPRQMEVIATQTYGTTTGMISLLATSFNRLLDPLVRALNIQGGISNVIFSFAERTLQEAGTFQRRLEVAETDEDRRRLAEEFIRGFVSNLRDAIQIVSGAFNAGDVKRIITPITELMREATMSAFKPLAETIMVQTVKTAIGIPGTLVGGSMVGALTDMRTEGLRSSLASMIGTTGGLASWIAMSALGREGWDVWRVGRGFLGGALLQYGLTEATPGWGMIMAPIGAYLLSHAFAPIGTRHLFSGLGSVIGNRLISIFNRLVTFITHPRVLGAVAITGTGLSLWREFRERQQYGPPPWYITAGRIGGNLLALAGATSGWIPLLVAGLGVSGLTELIDARRLRGVSHVAERYTTLSPVDVSRRIAESISLSEEERRAHVSRILTSMGTTYELGGEWWDKYRNQVIQAEIAPYRVVGSLSWGFRSLIELASRFPKYIGNLEIPFGIAEMRPEEIINYYGRTSAFRNVFDVVGRSFEKAGLRSDLAKELGTLFTLAIGYRLAGIPEEKREAVIEQFGKGSEAFMIGIAEIMNRYIRGELTREEFDVEVKRLIQRTISPLMPRGEKGKELTDRMVDVLIQSLREIASNTRETVHKIDNMSQQTFRERIYPTLAHEALVDILYRRGYEAPKTIPTEYFRPENAQQLRTRIQEIAANLEGMTKTAYTTAFQQGNLMLMAGAISGRELTGIRALYGRYVYQGLRSGLLSIESVASSPQQLLENIYAMRLAGYSREDISNVLRNVYASVVAQRFKDIDEQLSVATRHNLRVATPQGVLEAFGRATDAITKGGSEVENALTQLANRIRNIRFGVEEREKKRTPIEREVVAEREIPERMEIKEETKKPLLVEGGRGEEQEQKFRKEIEETKRRLEGEEEKEKKSLLDKFLEFIGPPPVPELIDLGEERTSEVRGKIPKPRRIVRKEIPKPEKESPLDRFLRSIEPPSIPESFVPESTSPFEVNRIIRKEIPDLSRIVIPTYPDLASKLPIPEEGGSTIMHVRKLHVTGSTSFG